MNTRAISFGSSPDPRRSGEPLQHFSHQAAVVLGAVATRCVLEHRLMRFLGVVQFRALADDGSVHSTMKQLLRGMSNHLGTCASRRVESHHDASAFAVDSRVSRVSVEELNHLLDRTKPEPGRNAWNQ